MIRRIGFRLVVVISFFVFGGLYIDWSMGQESKGDAGDRIDFLTDVVPILDAHCVKCHGPNKQTMDVRLDLRAAILRGGGSGEIIKVGQSAASRLIEVVTEEDPDLRMPPEGEPLDLREVAVLRGWIDQGALGPEDAHLLDKPLPWSFQPVVRPLVPESRVLEGEVAGGYGSIDRFLGNRLEREGLSFSALADRETILRRLYLVALGMPPTVEEVDRYITDESPDAYERLVERVLADPRYGERMARHWFDVIRYAESNGFETNRVRYNAWPFRDYVIASFNADKPYDRFVSEQIAGDVLGEELGTGFLVAGPFDLVKSPDIQLTLMQRQDELADLVNTTGTAFLGLTLGCARCHDHKFDPVTQKDFYALQGMLAGVQFAERPIREAQSEQSRHRIAELELQVEALEGQLAKWREISKERMATKKVREAVGAKRNEESFEPVKALGVRFTILASGGSQPCIDEWEVLREDGVNVAGASRGGKASASSTLPGYAIHKLEHINDEQVGNARSWISNEVNGGWVRIDFAESQIIRSMVWGRDRMEQFRDRVATQYVIEALLEDGSWKEIASGRDRISGGDDPQAWLGVFEGSEGQEVRSLVANLQGLRGELAKIVQGPTVWVGVFQQPGVIHRLYRGDPLMPREEVMPGVVESLSVQMQGQGAEQGQGAVQGQGAEQGQVDWEFLEANPRERSRREMLARWLVSESNPLTARVMSNRLWQMVFGVGIVETPSDFGGNGGEPKHPELLDWLASELMESGWSVKHLHRLMFQSFAFRQASLPRGDGLAKDADGRMLWRFPPRRLEAEAIRDSMLTVTGVMDGRMGGPGFYLQRVEQDNVYRYFPKEEVGPAEYRRMVYLTRIRQEQDPVFGAFDCPSGNQVIPRRARSNTPLQALNLFNSPFVIQQSKHMVDRLQREGSALDVEGKICLAFRWLLARDADSREIELSREFVEREGWEAFCRAMLNTSEFLFVF
jgi:hypothetical protein